MTEQNLLGSETKGADILARRLVDLGVKIIFGITGAGNLALIDACSREGIRFVFSHHEQASVMAAIGHAQVSGDVGVAMVTTGGGAANSLTGALSAHLDSVPVVIFAGNESDFHIEAMRDLRAFGVQGFDSVAVFKPVTKLAVRVNEHDDVGDLVERSFRIAAEGRPGPVYVEFPMNLQRKIALPQNPPRDNPPSSSSDTAVLSEPQSKSIRELIEVMKKSDRPLFYLGNGLRRNGALPYAIKIAEDFGIPFLLSWSAIDFIDESHPLLLGRAGIYGDRYANIALQNADLLVAVGTRLAIPQVGYDRNDFARNADRWAVDIDELELAKLDPFTWSTIHCDARVFAESLRVELDAAKLLPRTADWLQSLQKLRDEFPRIDQIGPPVKEGYVHSFDVVDFISDQLPSDAIVVTDVGAGLLTGHYGFRVREGQRFFTSQGLGEMGFGLPGAIGAQFAAPESMVICLNTDGGIMFNLQELQVVATHALPIKLFIFNNNGYTMIRTSQDNLFDGNRVGSDSGESLSFPSFSELARVFRFGYTEIDSVNSMRKGLPRALESDGPELIEVRMDPDQLYLPRLSTAKLNDGSLVSPSIEFLAPEIPLDQFSERVAGCGLTIEDEHS